MLENFKIAYNQIKKRISQLISLLNEHSSAFSIPLKQKEENLDYLSNFSFLRGHRSDTKTTPDPDPEKSSGSNRIRIHSRPLF